jgi:hypothetical protein
MSKLYPLLLSSTLVDDPKGQPSVAPGGHAGCQATIWHFKRLPCLILVRYVVKMVNYF